MSPSPPPNRVIYRCPFIPAEWIASHGFIPSRITPGAKKRTGPLNTSEGVCPFLNSFINELESEKDVSAVVFTSVCDQMRRAPEYLAEKSPLPKFLMHVPATWESKAAQKLYRSELHRLGSFLVNLGGQPASNKILRKTMQSYDEKRNILRDLKSKLPPRAFSESIARFHRTGQLDPIPEKQFKSGPKIPVALIGGPLTAQDLNLFDAIHQAGGFIVLDGTETGERTLPRSFKDKRLQEAPFEELADAYFGAIPDAFRRPNTLLYSWMEHEFEAEHVKGIILLRNIWCDIWHAEVHRIREWLQMPLLDIDLTGEDAVSRNKTRIHAFMELLQ